MSNKAELPSSSLECLLSPEDQRFFVPDVGLIRPYKVDPTYYNHRYFSESHIAYAGEGYNLEARLVKYADAIRNIECLSQPVLDLGCGPGFIVEGLRRKEVQVLGVDISSEAINKLSPKTARPLLYQASLTQLPFEDKQFMSAYSFHVLEHLTVEELGLALEEISRVVEQQLYFIIPTWDSLTNQALFDQIISDPTHRIIANRNWWIQKFAKFGWQHNDKGSDELDRLKRGWVFLFYR